MKRIIGSVMCVCLVLTCAVQGAEGKAAPGTPPAVLSKEELLKKLQELDASLQQHYRDKDYVAAEVDCRRMIELAPKLAGAHYNLACSLARQDKKEEALKALQTSVALGLRRRRAYQGGRRPGPAFARTRFAAAVKKAEENEQKALGPVEKSGGDQGPPHRRERR